MGGDGEFFGNMQDGFTGEWHGITDTIAPGATVEYTREFFIPADGTYFLQFEKIPPAAQVSCGGSTPFEFGQYPLLHGPAREIPVQLKQGVTTLCVRIKNPLTTEIPGDFSARLLDSCGEIIRRSFTVHPLPELRRELLPDDGNTDLSGWTPGAGAAFKSCGRFGYTMGHGLLDCSMARFGLITRPFISGHPGFDRNPVWHFTLLPDGEIPTGDSARNYQTAPGETITSDWSGFRWSKRLSSGKNLSFDCSILTPEILIETDMDYLNMGGLEAIGGFSSIMLPQKDGAVVKKLSRETFYQRQEDGELSRNFVMLSGSGQFPEVPVMFIFREQPEAITAVRDGMGRITDIRVQFASPIGWAMVLFPFGIELFKSGELTDKWYAKAAVRCSQCHQYALARPAACEEYFKGEKEQLEILQRFTFRIFKDSMNTPAVAASRFPPPLATAAENVPEIKLSPEAKSLEFPTKYGPLFGIEGKACAVYTLPVPEYRRDIALKLSPQDKERLSGLVSGDFNEFLRYHLEAPEVGNPGNYSFVFQYSFVLFIFNILTKREKEKLVRAINSGLRKVCDPDFSYIGPGGRKCYSWYTRREPFSGVEYAITYLHVSGISRYADCEKATIENADTPFIETDWGNAMSLYGTWYGAMFTDNWELIGKSWQVFRKAFDYYLVMMDWACMTAGYCENAVSWNDGTNYGGYLGFLNMAEMTGNHEDAALARYAYAKMCAMRMGLFYSTQSYFCKYFSAAPWMTAKFFHEEIDSSRAFQSCCKSIIHKGYREESLYNLTTEGHYKETWNAYARYMPEEVKKLLTLAENSNPVPICGPRPDGVPDSYHTFGSVFGWQEVMTYLMFCIITGRYEDSMLEKMIESAAANCRLSREFLGHVTWSKRRVPAEWAHVYLLATLYGRDGEKLLAWRNLEITDVSYPVLTLKYLRPGAWLEIMSHRKPSFTLNGRKAKAEPQRAMVYRIRIEADTELEFISQTEKNGKERQGTA